MKDTVLQKLHQVQLEILDELVRIFEKHELAYFLIGGTLLGAVRHKGFIPWDDDLDIVMPRADYERFIDLCPAELPERYFMQCTRTDPAYNQLFGKVCKKNTIYLERDNKYRGAFPQGIFVDIFPLDDAKKPVGLQARQQSLLHTLSTMAYIRQGEWQADPLRRLVSRPFSYAGLRRAQQRVMQWQNGKGYPYFVNFGSQYGVLKQTIAKDRYFPPAKVEFEGRMLNGLRDTEHYLVRIFGKNYMQPPPPDKRAQHTVVRLSFDTAGPDEVLD